MTPDVAFRSTNAWRRRFYTLAFCLVAPAMALADGSGHDHGPPIGDAVMELPIFDAHVHYKDEAWPFFPEKTVLELMDKSGVAMALVSSAPDAGTIKLWQYAPGRIVPEMQPYHSGIGQTSWSYVPGLADYIVERLDRYPHVGIGEIHIYFQDAKNRGMLERVADIALERDIYLHIHANHEEIRAMYAFGADLKIIWAHGGFDPPQIIEAMLDEFPTLHAELSYREHETLGNGAGKLNPVWKALLIKHADRFMVGTDTWSNEQWADYEFLVLRNRAILSELPRPVAEAIAYKNAERLFGRKITRDLIGTR